MHTVRTNSDKLQLLLKIGLLDGCANPNRPVPNQQTSIVTCWCIYVVCGRTKFLTSHKSQPSHVGLDHLDRVMALSSVQPFGYNPIYPFVSQIYLLYLEKPLKNYSNIRRFKSLASAQDLILAVGQADQTINDNKI
jgi:hypothetical protein